MTVNVSPVLTDDYYWLIKHIEGKKINKVITFDEKVISLRLEDNIIIKFQYLEDEIIYDLELPS